MGRKPTGLFRRHGTYVGLFIKGAVLSNNLKFSGQVPVLPDDEEKGADCCSTPGAQHHPGPYSVAAWEGSPSRGAEAGTQVDAVSISGPGKLFFPSFTTKGKKMTCMILAQCLVLGQRN